jgi:hypothetical protein
LQKKLVAKNILSTATSSNPQLQQVPAKIPLKSFSFDVTLPKFKWVINAIEREKFKTRFNTLNKNGFVTFQEAKNTEQGKLLESDDLEKICNLIGGDGKFDLRGFFIFMFLASNRAKGSISSIPDVIPESLLESATVANTANVASNANVDFRGVLKRPIERPRSASKADAGIAPWMQEIKARPVSTVVDESQMAALRAELKKGEHKVWECIGKEGNLKISLRSSDIVIEDEPPPYES